MTEMLKPTRRGVLAGGALVVSFSLFPLARLAAQDRPKLPGSLEDNPLLDSWIRVNADGTVTVFTGKVELGQGIKTALIQVAAEELRVSPDRIDLITADTDLTPDEGYTAGSQSMQNSGTAILHAAAQVREILSELAAARLDVSADQLRIEDGTISAPGGRSISYGELVGGRFLRYQASGTARALDPSSYAVIGQPMPRVDIPPKVTGGVAYVQDLRLPGMVHARVVRPPSYGARLRSIDAAAVEEMPGVLRVIRNGSHLAVIAEREEQAIAAMQALAEAAQWDEQPTLPDPDDIYEILLRMPAETEAITDGEPVEGGGGRIVEATYTRPYQMHGAIGPSCAIGHYAGGAMTLWTHSQGVYPLRESIAEMLRLPQNRVRCIHVEGSGCYGHNGADDVAADAALIAAAFPDRPVRVQWMREDEHLWEPYGPAMLGRARARLDGDGQIADFEYEVWSNAHSTRPGGAGLLMPAWHLEVPFVPPPPREIPQPAGGGDRNAIPLYAFPNTRVVKHFVPTMPLRVSALRALGAYTNVFALESFMDELAAAAGADPVEFRLRHMEDERARDVIRAAADRFGWSERGARQQGRGRGIGFARYKNLAAYTAVAVELEVDRTSGEIRLVRAAAANDSGQIVNPDGIRNQIEGGIVQAASWTLLEAVRFDNMRVTSQDWETYPILRFTNMFESIEVELIDRPGQPFLGTGEAAQGPTAAAIANAVADAVGARVRDLPLTPERVRTAVEGA